MPEATNESIIKTPIIFVHGAWHGSWCWEKWSTYFRDAGFEHVLPVEFRGHGYKTGEYKRARLEDYISDIKKFVSQMERTPILIGHSLGCSIIQGMMVDQQFPATVMLAPVPEPKLFRKVFLRQIARHPVIAARSLIERNMNAWVKSRHSAGFFFSNHIPESEIAQYMGWMQDESFRLFMLDLLWKAPHKPLTSPTLVVAAQDDTFFTVDMQRSTAQRLSADFLVSTTSGHDIMLDVSSRETALSVIEWLKTVK